MALRHRALARLHRHVPHVVGTDERVISSRIGDRDRDPPSGPKVAGEAVRVRDEVHERALRGPVAGPNAPLLIRLVRHPYALNPVRPGRRPGTQRPDPVQDRPDVREGSEKMRDWFEASHVRVGESRVDRQRPEHRDHPFERQRTALLLEDDSVPVGLP